MVFSRVHQKFCRVEIWTRRSLSLRCHALVCRRRKSRLARLAHRGMLSGVRGKSTNRQRWRREKIWYSANPLRGHSFRIVVLKSYARLLVCLFLPNPLVRPLVRPLIRPLMCPISPTPLLRPLLMLLMLLDMRVMQQWHAPDAPRLDTRPHPPPSRAQSPVKRIAKTGAQRVAEFRARKKRKEEEERKVQQVRCKPAPWPFVSTSIGEILFAHPHIIRPLPSKSNFIMSCARRLISTIVLETSSSCCEIEKLSSQTKERCRSARCRQTSQNCTADDNA